ncbi:hypothetical protein LT85_4782 [Collimonas arenae]|uniref:Uncharacterized protein n=1 Tax=Collimonas arenae TaxID=279058 RepID=A0A0A1FJM7_9BURK|nr:hypothetical protein LT85_4782 [Collimonas arenae]
MPQWQQRNNLGIAEWPDDTLPCAAAHSHLGQDYFCTAWCL